MTRMRDLIRLAEPLTDGDGFSDTLIERVRLFRSSEPIPRQPILYDAWIVANLQGRKTLIYSDRTLQYDQHSILCVTAGSPVECIGEGTPEKPLLAVVIDVRMDELMSMAARLPESHRAAPQPPRVVDVFPFTPELRDVYARLLRALHDPSDAAILGEHLVAEVVYRVLRHGLAGSLAALAANPSSEAILRALRIMHDGYAEDLSIQSLAARMAMSTSAFHEHFRELTSYTPLQYLKGVRLNKARQAIRAGAAPLKAVAAAVGYRSASQFSREYRRYFGCAPSHDRPPRNASG